MSNSTNDILQHNDKNTKRQTEDLFSQVEMDLIAAFNTFLREEKILFEISLNRSKKETLFAILEAEKITSDSSVKGFESLDDLFKALKSEKADI